MRVRFSSPPAQLRRYFTTFYLVEVDVPDGGTVTDHLHPEWANLRFHQGATPHASNGSGAAVSGTSFPATGPSSQAVRFTIGTTRMWGVGLLPLGWARYVRAEAGTLRNALGDGHRDPAFAQFAPLAASIFSQEPDPDAELARIESWFMDQPEMSVPDEDRIIALHSAVVDPECTDVAEMSRRTGMAQRQLERLARRHFGFSPKLLLRRQRFLRSIAHFMLDPTLRWIGAMDGQYHDQAQFVRDFRQFMGMTPRQYAALPRPILSAMIHERARFAGKPVQALDGPDGTSPPA